MKKLIAGLFLLYFATGAEAEQQKYLMVDLDGKVELERAYVVAPHIIITVPASVEGAESSKDGEFEGNRMWYFGTSPKHNVKSYISYRELEMSHDVPQEIIETYRSLLKVIQEMGGIFRIIEDETDMRMAEV